MKLFFDKSRQVVRTSYNELKHVITDYNGFRTLVTNYKIVQAF